MLTDLIVLDQFYNRDPFRLTSKWPKLTDDDPATRSKNIKDSEYELATQDSTLKLPKDHVLTFSAEKPIYVLVGANGSGKSTFLHAVAHSAFNAQFFKRFGRTRLFSGTVGLKPDARPCQNVLGVSREVDSTGYAYTSHNLPRLLQKWEDKRVQDYFFAAVELYLPRDELFEGIHFAPYAALTTDQAVNKLRRLFVHNDGHSGPKKDEPFEAKLENLPGKISTRVSNLAEKISLNEERAYQRVAYLVENNPGFPTYPHPINVFGQYELHFSSDEKVSIGIYDAGINGTKSSGEIARKTLDAIATTNLLLLDEPTNHLDRTGKKWFRDEYIKKLADKDGSILIATHDELLIDAVTNMGGGLIDMDKAPISISDSSR